MPILVALLAFPAAIWLGALASGLYARWRFTRHGDTFRCKLRIDSGDFSGIGSRWSHRWRRARWVRTVLLVHRGFVRPQTVPLSVIAVEKAIQTVPVPCGRGLGRAPLMLVTRLDEGAVVEVAAAEHCRTLLTGPFVAAAIPGLPQAPVEPP